MRSGRFGRTLLQRWRDFADRRDGPQTCWPWKGSSSEGGYGQISVGTKAAGDKRLVMAHRLAYELFVGPIQNGMLVRHRCDHPWCVNPSHLEIGTHADNARDAIERGRFVAPPRKAKLTRADAEVIREEIANGHISRRQASRRWGVSIGHIDRILARRAWR
jgi:hypothetical protein